MSNDDLQAIVDSYKMVQMERSQADALKHREGRWGHVVGAQRVATRESVDKGGYSIICNACSL